MYIQLCQIQRHLPPRLGREMDQVRINEIRNNPPYEVEEHVQYSMEIEILIVKEAGRLDRGETDQPNSHLNTIYNILGWY